MLDVPRLLEQLDAVIKDVSRAFLAADARFGAVGVRDAAQQCLAASSRLLWKQPEKRKMKTPCELLTLLTQRMQARLAMVSVQMASRSGRLMLDACPPSDAGSAEQQLEKLDPSFKENPGAGAPPEAREGAGSAAPPPKVSSDPEAAKCCYAVLGLLRAALPADVRRAYHTCARASHPDKPGGSHAAFLAVARAFEVLSIHAERANYDASLLSAGSSDGVLNPVVPKEPAAAPVQQALNPAYLCLAMLTQRCKILIHSCSSIVIDNI
ncbi:unnamed protein product, partial [Polarella glacialis]